MRLSLILSGLLLLCASSVSADPVQLGGGFFDFSGNTTIFSPEAVLPTTAKLDLQYVNVPGEPCALCDFTIGVGETGSWHLFDINPDFLARLTNTANELLFVQSGGGLGNLESVWFGAADRTTWVVEFIRFTVTHHVFTPIPIPVGIHFEREIQGTWHLYGTGDRVVPEPSVLALLLVAGAAWYRARH